MGNGGINYLTPNYTILKEIFFTILYTAQNKKEIQKSAILLWTHK